MGCFYSFPLVFIIISRKFFLFLCLFLLSCTHVKHTVVNDDSQSFKQSSVFMKGLDLFRKGKLNEARDQFKMLNRGDKYFVRGLLEIQKINYIKNDWDYFFGLAVYYRNALLSSYEMSVKNFQQEILTLEILALIRQCQFYESKKIIEWSMELAEKIKKDYSKIKKAIYFFNLEKLIGDQKRNKDKVDWRKRIYLWPLSPSQLKWLDNPKNLRMKVNNRC